jgi:hypothetical protein
MLEPLTTKDPVTLSEPVTAIVLPLSAAGEMVWPTRSATICAELDTVPGDGVAVAERAYEAVTA